MANYPQLDDQVGVWKLKNVNDAVMGGYWREAGSKAVFGGGFNSSNAYTANIDTIKMASAGNAKLLFATYNGMRVGRVYD